MFDYEQATENAIRFIKSMSRDEWIAFLKEGGLLREDEEPEPDDPTRPEQLLYGGDWYEEYFVRQDGESELSDGGVQKVDGIAQSQ